MTAKSPDSRQALFAGSFDPFTAGHASIVERGLALFDTVVIAIGVNAAKASATAAEARAEAIRAIYAAAPEGSVEVVVYSDRLTVDIARELGCGWLLRGVRSARDFEYERDLADLNRRISGLDTVILFTLPEHAAISSSAVRELQHYGHDASSLLPTPYHPSK